MLSVNSVFPWQCMREINKKINTNKNGCLVISSVCFYLSHTPRFSLFLSSDCWVESVRVCKLQKCVLCVHWRDRFPSADNEAPFPDEEAVSILSLTVAIRAWRAINSLGSPCVFESCPSAPPCKPLSISGFYQVPGQDYTNVILMPPKNLTSKGPVLFETVLFIPTYLMCTFF